MPLLKCKLQFCNKMQDFWIIALWSLKEQFHFFEGHESTYFCLHVSPRLVKSIWCCDLTLLVFFLQWPTHPQRHLSNFSTFSKLFLIKRKKKSSSVLFLSRKLDEQTKLQQISMSTTVKRKVPLSRCSATAAESSPRQWLQTVGRQKIALPWVCFLPQWGQWQPGKKHWKRHCPAYRKLRMFPIYWGTIPAPCEPGNSPQLWCTTGLLFTLTLIQSSQWSQEWFFSSAFTGLWMWSIAGCSSGCSWDTGMCFAGNGNRWS